MTKDSDDFGAEMAKAGVRHLAKRQEKVVLPSPRNSLNAPLSRQAAASDQPRDNDPLHYRGVKWLGPHDIVEFRRSGIQHEAFKKLKKGQYEIGDDIDLHGYRIDEAKVALFQFVSSCIQHNIRCAIVIHGKGWHTSGDSTEAKPDENNRHVSRMKSHVVHWLMSISDVLALSSAQSRDGGTGAVYVLFKSSSR